MPPEGTENRIAVEHRRYSQAVQDYNTDISLFLNNIVVGMSGFTRNDAYFKAEEGSSQAPKVQFRGVAPQPLPTSPK